MKYIIAKSVKELHLRSLNWQILLQALHKLLELAGKKLYFIFNSFSDKYQDFCRLFEVKKFPTLIFFTQDFRAYQYQGDLNANQIVEEFLNGKKYEKGD